jgi:hypothetical protein
MITNKADNSVISDNAIHEATNYWKSEILHYTNSSDKWIPESSVFRWEPHTEINGRGDPLHWPRDTLYPLKLALNSSTSGGRSVDIVRLRTKATERFISCSCKLSEQCLCPKSLGVKESLVWKFHGIDWSSVLPERRLFETTASGIKFFIGVRCLSLSLPPCGKLSLSDDTFSKLMRFSR